MSFLMLTNLPLIHSDFFKFKSLAYNSSLNFSSLESAEVTKALTSVYKHEKYLSGHGLSRYISIYEYLWVYEAGILSVRDLSADEREPNCSTCTVVVDTGYTCGGVCGAGTTFYLALIDGEWRIGWYSIWVS